MYNPILLEQVKRKLNVTWEDDDTTARIEEIIESAIPVLLYKIGIADPDFDFSAKGEENTLFLAYCLYDWNHVVEDFDLNYERMISETRAKHEVQSYIESEENENAEV